MSGQWAGSTRAQRLPRDWHRIRRRILKRDPICKQSDCTSPSQEVDHIQAGDDHRDSNLQGLCTPHHREKTMREATQARAARPKLARTPEPHPGIT